MTDVYLNLVNNEWIPCSKENAWKDEKGRAFSLNVKLIQKLEQIKNLQRDKWDAVFIIDGRERSGKSSLACACGWYLSKMKMGLVNFATGISDVAKKIESIPDNSVLVMDEGSTMFGSKDSTGKQQKALIKILDVVGQKNLIFIICLPCFFDLNKTIAIRRSLFLLHIKPKELTDSWKREPFYYYSEKTKAMLYYNGKKNYDSYAYPTPNWDGRYYEFIPPFWKEYEEIVKKASLKEVIADGIGEVRKDVMIKDKYAQLMYNLVYEKGYIQKDICEWSGLSKMMVSTLVNYHKNKIAMNSPPISRLDSIQTKALITL